MKDKINEIKELLKCLSGEKPCTNCYLSDKAHEEGTFCINLIAEMTLDLLNEIQEKIENGTLIELPCKVGSTVYVISKKALKGHWEEHRYIVDKWGKLAVYEKEFNLVLFSVSKVGKDYFLTRAEAEQKLKELKGEVWERFYLEERQSETSGFMEI